MAHFRHALVAAVRPIIAAVILVDFIPPPQHADPHIERTAVVLSFEPKLDVRRERKAFELQAVATDRHLYVE